MTIIKKTPLGQLSYLKRKEEELLAQNEAGTLGINYLNLSIFPVNASDLILIPEEEARSAKAAVIRREGKEVILAALHPSSPEIASLQKTLEDQGLLVQKVAVSFSSLLYVWEKYKLYKKTAKELRQIFIIEEARARQLREALKTRHEVEKQFSSLTSEDSSSFLETLFIGAIQAGSNDIHIEPEEKGVKVRFRIDGILQDVSTIEKPFYAHALNRLKVLSELTLNIKEQAQDGRFTIRQQQKEGDKDIDVRISLIPSYFGETVVMRLLGVAVSLLDIETLGLEEHQLEILLATLALPNGMLLTTGPTGSGKTTLLYAALAKVKKPEVNIITIEDPIEYKIEGITQTQVNKEEGYTFEKGLEAVLRQDPDVVLIGEIRSKETANTAINASLTGHLVLSTLHTNDATGSIQRLKNLHVQISTIPSALRLVIAQRLVRRLCPQCKKRVEISEDKKQHINEELARIPKLSHASIPSLPANLFEPTGCEKCFGTGYLGRTAVFELFDITTEMGEKILNDANSYEIRKAAIENGMLTLTQHALLKVIAGETSLQEVERVAGESE